MRTPLPRGESASRGAIVRVMLGHAVAVVLLVSTLAGPPAGAAERGEDNAWVQSIIEEDDFWAPDNKDRHYTHGIRLSTTSPNVQEPFWNAPFEALGNHTPVFPNLAPPADADAEHVARRYNIILLGQNMYTPQNPALFNPDPRDRPYAGWLYGGIGLMQDTPGSLTDGIDRFDELALKLGIVGPGSLANATQTRYHLLIDVGAFAGWHAQLRNEPAVDLYYERKWRYHDESASGWGVDAIPQAGLRVGNVYDYASAGGMLRFGRNLRVDYGPPRIDLNTGADYLNLERLSAGAWGVYVFIGGEARLVLHNIFLDGNDFKSSASVQKIPAVGDAEAGSALFWGHYRLSYTYVLRSPEFVHQTGPDHYASLNLTLHLAF